MHAPEFKPAEYGRATAGYSVAVLHIASRYALFPGNPQHAGSFSFPVLYEEVEIDKLDDLFSGADYIGQRLLEAAQRAIDNGARSIVGACGSFAYHQRFVTERLPVPAYLSVLTQLPLLQSAMLGSGLGVICASASAMNERVYEQCGVADTGGLTIAEMIGRPEFDRFIAGERDIDFDKLSRETSEAARELKATDPKLAGILLQCSDLCPFAPGLQSESGVPVFDAALLIRWAHMTATYPTLPNACY